MKEQIEDYRKGAIGALMDEHEHAAEEFYQLMSTVSQEDFVYVVDRSTEDENCHSIQTICSHMVSAGYGYSNMIRRKVGVDQTKKFDGSLAAVAEVPRQIKEMLEYMVETTEPLDKYRYSPEDLMLDSSAGILNMDLLLEHSICHLLRHRRQIEKFILQLRNK